ncbi:MAG: hypothetical protein O3B70_03670 [Bacteroidetes bacterium]|nr:hypothetical protein [Bacteroidota bacterium]MDA0903411.1 hypothetical protein [Bacteroidota bacterium]MDA1241557.1 hypothetical protein [Bacteroidota bacterium]
MNMRAIASHVIICFLLIMSSSLSAAQSVTKDNPTSSNQDTKSAVEDKKSLPSSWRHVEFNLISDVPGADIASVLDEPRYGFALTTVKHERGSLFDGGLDVGFQPIGRFDTTVTLYSNNTSQQADVKLRNQLAHAHYLLRVTLFQRTKIQPYVEVFAGVRGSILGTTIKLEDDTWRDVQADVPTRDFNLSYGYAGGVRLQIGERTFIQARYAQLQQLQGGNEVLVADLNQLALDNEGRVSAVATESMQLPSHAVRVGLAINL